MARKRGRKEEEKEQGEREESKKRRREEKKGKEGKKERVNEGRKEGKWNGGRKGGKEGGSQLKPQIFTRTSSVQWQSQENITKPLTLWQEVREGEERLMSATVKHRKTRVGECYLETRGGSLSHRG
jgi:hypothetical protein